MGRSARRYGIAGLLFVGACLVAAGPPTPTASPTATQQISVPSLQATPVPVTPKAAQPTATTRLLQTATVAPPSVTPSVGRPTLTPTPKQDTATPTAGRPTLTPTATVPTATPTREQPTATPTREHPTPTPIATVSTATPTPQRPTLTPTAVVPTATSTEEQPTATPEPSEPAQMPEPAPPTEVPTAAAEPTPEFVAPPGKALFVFYNYTGEDWNIDVGPHLLQVPATKPGEPYAVVTLELEPGTYTLMGSSPATGRQIHTMDGGLYIEFTVQAGDVYPSGVRY